MKTRILFSCIRMHRTADGALSGNFFHCLHLLEALFRLEQSDFEIVVHADHHTSPVLEEIIGPENLFVSKSTVDSVQRMEFEIRRALRKIAPGIYHKATGQLPLLPTKPIAIWGIADLGFKHIPMSKLQRMYKILSYKLSAHRAKAIIAVSEATRVEAMETLGIPATRIKTIHHGATKFRDAIEVIDGLTSPFLITFGHHAHKNVQASIRVAADLKTSGIPIELVVIGKSPNKDALLALAKDLGIVQAVRFVGHVTNGQLRYLYENAICLLFLSRHEGFGLPVLEAQAFRCPVVSSNVFSLPEVIGNSAKVFDCDDIEGVANQVRRFLSDEDFRKLCVANGVENTLRFSWEYAAEQTLAIYRELGSTPC